MQDSVVTIDMEVKKVCYPVFPHKFPEIEYPSFFKPTEMSKFIFTILFLLPMLAMAQEDFYDRLNALRKKRLMRPLKVDEKLEAEVKRWLIVADGRVMHDWKTFRAEVVTNCLDPLECWMESKPHKRIIMKRKYRYIGFYVVKGVAGARLK